MPPKSNSRRANFRPFWPVAPPATNVPVTQPSAPETVQELNSRDNEISSTHSREHK